MKLNEQDVEVTVRECRRCGARFTCPKGSRPPNGECGVCTPSLFGVAPAGEGLVDGGLRP